LKNIIHSICACNKKFHEKTRHPLVSIINLAYEQEDIQLKMGSYAVILRQIDADSYCYGRKKYDFSDGTLIFRSPDKAIALDTDKTTKKYGTMLVFHPELLCGTTLATKIKDYTFFKYKENEALHLSSCEMKQILQAFNCIQDELEWGIDKYSTTIICNKIETLLNYCCRYYNRQFTTRHDASSLQMNEAQKMIDQYLTSQKYDSCNPPCTCKFSTKLGLSSAYFNDMLKYETGKNFNDYINLRRIELAKQLLLGTNKSEQDIAQELGYCSAGRFRQMFIKLTGNTPEAYRS
jgi:AraC-like DNA-binding protein